MRPRKRDKDSEVKKQDHKPDHELFIQAYEKPTQIYKFLRARFKYSPYFLYRNLTYMMRKPKKHKTSRNYFRLDSLMSRMEEQTRQASLVNASFEYLTIKYLGFFNKEEATETVKIETLLLKICQKKRKENNCPVVTRTFGTVFAPCNPSENSSPKKTRIVIPTEAFSLSNGHFVKSYHLLLRVGTVTPNGVLNKSDSDMNGPAAKKRKMSNGIEEKTYEFQYGTNLTVYDKRNRCVLPDGDYQLLMHELTQNSPKLPHVNTSWETIPDKDEPEMSPAFEDFAVGPKLKLRLCWTNNPDTEDSAANSTTETSEICNSLTSMSNKENNNPDNNGVMKMSSTPKEDNNLQIIYQFLYSNNSRQQTEPHKDFYCPWCPKLDCLNLYALLKHLKLCHARFTFAYTEITNGARIDVALNEKYDGSYIGASRDIAYGSIGFGVNKRGPVRRAPVSKILVCRPKRPRRFSLSEFLNEKDENDVDGQRAYISGHNRLYHHTTTCLPIYPKEMDVDSEDESDPKWLQKKTSMMIDDFTDVNDGEKELMKMWNLHVMKHGFVGDCQIPLACNKFLNARGHELLRKNLYRNFVLHLCNMFDFGLISPVNVYTTIQRLQEQIGEEPGISNILKESWSVQHKNWLQSNRNPTHRL